MNIICNSKFYYGSFFVVLAVKVVDFIGMNLWTQCTYGHSVCMYIVYVSGHCIYGHSVCIHFRSPYKYTTRRRVLKYNLLITM